MLGLIMEEKGYTLNKLQNLASMYQQVPGEWHCCWNFNGNQAWVSNNSLT